MSEGHDFIRKVPSRNHIVHCPNRGKVLFVTVAVAGRRALLDNAASHVIIVDSWRNAEAWNVGRYVVMPDHVHFFCTPASHVGFDTWVRYWKRLVTQAWPNSGDLPLWIPGAWDTQLRTRRHYGEK